MIREVLEFVVNWDKYRLYIDFFYRAVNTYTDSKRYTHWYLYLLNLTKLRVSITMNSKTTNLKQRRALTILEKQIICQKRQKPEYAKEKLSDFGKYFLDDQDLPVPTSTLSDILKEKKKWLNLDTASSGSGSWKKKQWTAQFPLLEEYLYNGDISYDEGSLQKVRTVTMTMTMMDVECLRLI